MAQSAKSEYPALVDAVVVAGGEQVIAKLKSIGSATRKVVFEMSDGAEVETVVKPDMPNLQNVHPGDAVVIDYVDRLAVAVEKALTPLKGTDRISKKAIAPEAAGMPGKPYTMVREASALCRRSMRAHMP